MLRLFSENKSILLKKTVLCVLLTLLFLLCGVSFATEQEGDPAPPEADASMEADVKPWHTHTMDPGETYDVGTASKNTTVYISSAGKYYLKGKSTYCRVVVESGGVDLYLKDGLNLDPGIYSYVGSSTAAITIKDQGGTVRIISEKYANIYLGGYYYAPCIRKDDHTTKLIFETEDPSQPGTITCWRSAASKSTGIGNVYRVIAGNQYTGNVEFKSGKIVATGGTDAAGIGGSSGGGDVRNYVFSGAEVVATGSGHGAGIGGGLNGSVNNIVISGGMITAKGDHGAGIGSGQDNGSTATRCGTIKITGGNITATSKLGSGIGSGTDGHTDRIIISGGMIYAESEKYGTAIGASAGNFSGKCSQIDISGGTVYASAGVSGVGIGSSTCGESGNTTINISGGYIVATADKGGISIGGGGAGGAFDKGHCYVNISGGTIQCLPTLGTHISSRYSLTCTITGGSLCAHVSNTPTDGKGNKVYLVNVDMRGCPEKTPVTEADITGLTADYKIKDVVTLHYDTDDKGSYSIVYPWLPVDATVTEMTAGGVQYAGEVKAIDGEGSLWPGTKITLKVNAEGGKDGSATAVYGRSKAEDIVSPVRPGYTLSKYVVKIGTEVAVMEKDGSFIKNVSGYTDANGKWAMQGGDATFYAHWNANPFTVSFNGNKPASASTTVEGSMADQAFTYGTSQQLTANAFTLPGYTFTGWNTKADGTGTSVADQAEACKLTTESKITLFAQWKPITYYVKFDPNGGSGTMERQLFTFDQSQALTKNKFTNGKKVFAGWQRVPSVGSWYSDGQTVENLASAQDAEVTMKALWSVPVKINIRITLDNEAATDCKISLTDAEGASYEPAFAINDGVYTYDGNEFPPDPREYTVMINTCDTGRTVTVPGETVETFDYYTVEVKPGEHFSSCSIAPSDSGENSVMFDDDTEGWPLGSKFLIMVTGPKEGYAFFQWQSPAVDPDFIEGTSEKSNPVKVALKGKLSMLAEARPVSYSVSFNPNVPAGASTSVTGSMENQLFAFDSFQNLVPNAYKLKGYTFTGWSTTPEGAAAFGDGELINYNLTAEEGAEVTLYAVWKPITYKVVFDGNLGTGTMPDKVLTFDKPEALPENRFTLTDQHFTGWYTYIGGRYRAFSNQAQVVNLASAQDETVTLYAQWDHDTYTVIYVANDGSDRSYDETVWTHMPNVIRGCTFTRKGYEFTCWSNDPSGNGASYAPGEEYTDLTLPNASITLYAQWKQKSVPLTGDESLPLLWAALAAAAAVGAVLTLRRGKKIY